MKSNKLNKVLELEKHSLESKPAIDSLEIPFLGIRSDITFGNLCCSMSARSLIKVDTHILYRNKRGTVNHRIPEI